MAESTRAFTIDCAKTPGAASASMASPRARGVTAARMFMGFIGTWLSVRATADGLFTGAHLPPTNAAAARRTGFTRASQLNGGRQCP